MQANTLMVHAERASSGEQANTADTCTASVGLVTTAAVKC